MPRGGSHPQRGLTNKLCRICGEMFMPHIDSQTVCQSDECKKERREAYIAEYRAKPENKEAHRKATRKYRQEHPANRLLSSIRNRQKDATITESWIQTRLDVGVCEASGIDFDMEYTAEPVDSNYGNLKPWIPTIDRIDPHKGYSPANCRVVCWIFNRAKGRNLDKDMVRLAEGIIKTIGVLK